MKIGFIGAGKAGFTLGKYFCINGVDVSGYYSRNSESAIEAASFTGTKYFETVEQIINESNVLFLTVPDSSIKNIWDILKPLPISGKIICHCSGALSSRIFDEIDKKQAYGCSVHPFFAISSKYYSYKDFSQAFFTLEGDEKGLCILEKFLQRIGNSVCVIRNDNKVKYHTAAVFLSNHVNALAHIGCKLLNECGLDDKISSDALKTLFYSHCKQLSENGPIKSLTGPVERNDIQTVTKHIDCLDGNIKMIYGLLSEILIEIAQEKHVDCDYSNMKDFIKKETEEIL